MRPHRTLSWLIPALVLAVTAAAFLPALGNGFVAWDDPMNILENPHIRGLGWDQLRWMFWGSISLGNFEPFNWLLLDLIRSFSGLDPLGYHLAGLLLHLGVTVALYLLLLRLLRLAAAPTRPDEQTPLRLSAGAGTLFFAVHPLRAEVVAWASGQHYIPAVIAALLSVLAYLRSYAPAGAAAGTRHWPKESIAWYAASLLFFPICVSLPLAFVVLDIYPLRRLGPDPSSWLKTEHRPVWSEKIPFLGLALAAGVAMLACRQAHGSLLTVARYDVSQRLAQAVSGIWLYLAHTLAPIRLSPYHPLDPHVEFWTWPYWAGGAAVLAVTAGLGAARRAWPAGLAAWVFYLATVAPVLGLAQSGKQASADRYTYFSCLAWSALAAGALFRLWRGRSGRRIGPTVLGLSLLGIGVLAGSTKRQVAIWRNSQTLWSHGVQRDPALAEWQYNLGSLRYQQARARSDARDRQSDLEEAVRHFRQALILRPDDWAACNNLGNALFFMERYEDAARYYARALQIRPDYPIAHNNLGNTLIRLGRTGEAETHLLEALRLEPELADTHVVLGDLLVSQGRTKQAAEHYEAAARLRPDADIRGRLDRARLRKSK